MQMISQVMTRDVRVVAPHESVQRAAQMMDELNVGALPVCDGERLVGMVTDRDITVRATAAGRAPGDAHVDEVMSTDVRWCFEDEDVDDVVRKMADTQVRRVPVVSHDDAHRLVGIVALGDLLTRGRQQQATQAAAQISTPSAPDLAQAGQGGQAGAGYDPRVSGITAEGGSPHGGEITGSGGTQPGADPGSYAAGSEVGGDIGESVAGASGSGAGNLADQGVTAPGGLGGSAGAVAATGGTDAAAGAKGVQTAGSPGKVARNSEQEERPEAQRGAGGGASGASGGPAGSGGTAGSGAGGPP